MLEKLIKLILEDEDIKAALINALNGEDRWKEIYKIENDALFGPYAHAYWDEAEKICLLECWPGYKMGGMVRDVRLFDNYVEAIEWAKVRLQEMLEEK